MTTRFCKLEAAKEGRSILDGYDRVKDQWSFSFDGPFWKAVEHAHSLGRRGAGATVAIIDTACDRDIPALQDRITHVTTCVPRALGPENTEHGTAVALLIANVAPECRFEVYSVRREDGTIDASDVAYAVGEAAKSEAHILNLSLGAAQTVLDLDERLQHASQDVVLACRFGASPQHSRWALLNQILPDYPDCVLCQETSAAARRGKLVFAAAGNDASEILCPARAEEVFAAGFQTKEKRIVLPGADGGREVRTTSVVKEQSVFVDLPLEEVSGVLGTSFASPLFAGVAALGVTAEEFSGYLSTIPLAYEAISAHTEIKIERAKIGHYDPRMAAPLQQVRDLFSAAFKRLPHVHSELELKHRSDQTSVTITDPSNCIACGFFAYPLYVNFGLYLLEQNYPHEARVLFEVARAFAPWCGAAAADLGRTLEELGELEQALSLYNTALTLEPGIQPYLESQKRITAKLGRS